MVQQWRFQASTQGVQVPWGTKIMQAVWGFQNNQKCERNSRKKWALSWPTLTVPTQCHLITSSSFKLRDSNLGCSRSEDRAHKVQFSINLSRHQLSSSLEFVALLPKLDSCIYIQGHFSGNLGDDLSWLISQNVITVPSPCKSCYNWWFICSLSDGTMSSSATNTGSLCSIF